MPDGSFQRFHIVEAPIMHPDLAKKYPDIKSYAGYGIEDPTAYLRFDMTPQGFHAMMLNAASGHVFIDPYAREGIEHYVVYFKKDFYVDKPWKCDGSHDDDKQEPLPISSFEKAGDCKLRTYSLALACTGEYAAFHGGTASQALAAMNTTMTRVNGIFERDLSVTMQMVANNDLLVFTNASTDPYSNYDATAMLTENKNTCNNVIGSANYDIGHVFSTGGGGLAYVKAICNSTYKAGGVTGTTSPVGDPFDIDYVCHEMGHQFGANHTQNNNCISNSTTSVEPGSGSTIMGYAGICTPNIQAHSDAYFHAISIQEIQAFISGNGAGNACATLSTINIVPTFTAIPDYAVPKSTPFFLTGNGTDPNSGDVLSYCWEQMDYALATMPPVSTSMGGPCFRSLPPSTSPVRYFPNLTAVINNTMPAWEVLPSVARTLNFRLTVRDNHIGGGCTKEDNIVVTVASSGPFVVTAPNTAISWPALSAQTVTWNVAGTTSSPVSAANVDILLSLDGGLTYTITLKSATVNDGTEVVTLPENQTTQARIMVRGTGKIFYDISNVNFTIGQPAPDFNLNATPSPQTLCKGGSSTITVSVGAISNFSGNVSLSATGLPSGVTATFSPATVSAPGNSILTLSGTASVTVGSYNITISGVGSTGTKTKVTAIAVVTTPAQAVQSAPATGITGASLTPVLSWTAVAGATSYEVQIANNSTFNNPIVNTAGITTLSYTSPALPASTLLYWRVRAVNSCGAGVFSASRTFTTLAFNPKFEHGTLTNVTDQWQTVNLNNSYTSMVVVASVVMPNSSYASLVTRVQNASGNSFQVKVQIAGNATGAAGPVTVYYMVAEEGNYTLAANGIKFEAKKYLSTKTSRFSSSTATWLYEPITFGNTYTVPVMVGQVMTYNDPNWSVFWSSMNTKMASPATASSRSIGKHIGQDNVNLTRANETLGYMVFESGAGTINGKRYAAALGADAVLGITDNANGYSYALTGFGAVEAAVVSSAGQDATEGSWAVLATSAPLITTSIKTWALEDQITDSERTHTTDQVCYFVIGTPPTAAPDTDERETVMDEENQSSATSPESMMAYPNPFTNELTIEFEQEEAGSPTVLMSDAYGRMVYKAVLSPSIPSHRVEKINLEGLDGMGYFFLQVIDGEKHSVVKIVRGR